MRPVWSESSIPAWRNLGPFATHWAHSDDSDQTVRMPRLIWVFAGRTVTLLVFSWRGSYAKKAILALIALKHLRYVHIPTVPENVNGINVGNTNHPRIYFHQQNRKSELYKHLRVNSYNHVVIFGRNPWSWDRWKFPENNLELRFFILKHNIRINAIYNDAY